MCFWPPKIHNLKTFLEDEMSITFLGSALLAFL